jgi:hypothetical protein
MNLQKYSLLLYQKQVWPVQHLEACKPLERLQS